MTKFYGSSAINEALEKIADDLDVSPSKYAEAKQHYEAVGQWLGDEDSALAPFSPSIFPQGSFALGTAIRPLEQDEYDVDAVCLLQLSPDSITQEQLKEMVGTRLLHPKSRYREMLDPKEGGRRCWTIKYADGSKFHLDVLPAIPDPQPAEGVAPDLAKDAILITCKDTWSDPHRTWPKSNPRAYATWFKARMFVRLMEQKREIAMEARAEVEEIEDYEIRTPLQRMIQLFKRHRDERYDGDEDKPISIIITTLAAMAYENEADLVEAINNVVPRMRSLVRQHNGVWWVPNPVNPQENFADKWGGTPRKAELFFDWLSAIEAQHQSLLKTSGISMESILTESYGPRATRVLQTGEASPSKGPIILVPKKTGAATPAASLAASPSKPWRE